MWKQVGISITEGYYSVCNGLVFDSDGSIYIDYTPSIKDKNFVSPVVRKLVGDNWVRLGGSFSWSAPSSLAISPNDTLYATNPSSFSGLSLRKFSNAWEYVDDPDGLTMATVTRQKIAFAADGALYVVYAALKNKNKLSVQKLVNSKWELVGNANFSNPGASNVSIDLASDGTPYVTYQDSALNGTAVVQRFKNGEWATISQAGLSKGVANYLNTAIAPDGTLYVTFCDAGANDRPIVKKYSNGSWISVAQSYLPATKATYTKIAVSKTGIPYLTYDDYNLGLLAFVKIFANNQWTNVVSGSISVQSANNIVLKTTKAGVPYIAYDDSFYGGKVSVKKYIAGNWQYVGTPTISQTGISPTYLDMALAPDGTPYVIYRDSSQTSCIVKKYDGTSWVGLGNNIAPYGGLSFKITIAPNGTPYVAYADGGTGNIVSVQKYSNGSWTYVGKAASSARVPTEVNLAIDKNNILYIAYFDALTKKLMAERFDGSTWVSMNAEKLTSGTARDINFITGPDNTPYIAFYDIAANNIVVGTYTNGNWQATTVTTGSKQGYRLPKLLFDPSGQQYLAFLANSYPNGQLFKLSNGTWSDTGSGSITPYQASNLDVAFQPNGDLFYGYVNGLVYARVKPKNYDAVPPVISNIFPSTGSTGTVITISGFNFNNISSVKIGASKAASFNVGPDGILATVGTGSTGPVTVTTTNGTAIFEQFTYTNPPPAIKSFSPLFGDINTTVTIKGKNFSSTPAKNLVYFGAVAAPVITATDSILTVQVPVGATSEPITVTVNKLTAYAAGGFNVTFKSTNTFTPATFAIKQNFSDIAQPSSITVKDMDGNGTPDVVITGGGTAILSNTSTKDAFVFKSSFAENQGGVDVTTGDFDGDGKSDLAVANTFVNTYKNNSTPGNTSFLTYGQAMLAADYSYQILVGDIDGDGRPDILSISNAGLILSVFRNDGTSKNYTFFEDPVSFNYDSFPRGISLADVDGDGKTDVVAILPDYSKLDGAGYVSVLKNTSTTGKISFKQVAFATRLYTGNIPRQLVVTDINNDGKPDIVVPNNDSNSVSIFKNTSTKDAISFTAGTEFTTGINPTSVTVADLDGDSLPDVAVTNSNNSISVLKNTSSANGISLAPKIDYKTNYFQPGSITAADIDGDQAPELIVANYSGGNATIFKNSVIRLNVPTTNFAISIESATCKGSANGSVNITAAQIFTYTAKFTGNGINKSVAFTKTTAFNDLPAGTYHLCITMAEESTYEQCYDVVVTEPKDLALFSTVNVEDKMIKMSFTGGSVYNINLNGINYTTTNNSISLPLNAGNNKLSVSTDKDCQGIIQKIINLAGVITPYPVPFQNTLNVNIGNTQVSNILVQIYAASDGKPVYIKQFSNRTGVLPLDVSAFKTGVYSLHLTLDGNENVFKVIKQ
jgi:hypothetical protein